MPFDPRLVVLGVVCQLLAGVLFTSAVARGHPRQLLRDLLGGMPPGLEALRTAIFSRVQNQAAAIYYTLGLALMLAGFLSPGAAADWRLEATGAVVLVCGLALYMLFSRRFADRLLRRHLLEHLRANPFPFEEHVDLARQVGELFGVQSTGDDTLESYAARLRSALGLPEVTGRRSRRSAARFYTELGQGSDAI